MPIGGPFHHPNAHSIANAATTQCLIDEKIAHLEECIRQLKLQRNGLAEISKLPPEILSSIFFFASVGRTPESPLFPCFYFSHVSRTWRSVALNTPNLWHVLPHSIPWATAMLERSKGVDLILGSFISDQSRIFLTEVLTKHTPRIREVDLSGFKISTMFENLHQSLRPHSLKFDFRGDDCTFPTGVMETGNLRTLDITNYGGPWFSLSLPVLTNLRLYNITNPPPLSEFLEMLRGLPTLEVLDMEDSFPLPNDPGRSVGRMELRRLSYLRLSSTRDYKEVTNILFVIVVPPTATLKLNFVKRQHDATTQEIKTILDELKSSLSTFFCRVTDLSYCGLHISRENRRLCLNAWKDGGSSAMTDLELNLTLPASFQNILGPILPCFPLSNITSLTLDIPIGHTLVQGTFGQLSHLQNVKVVADSTFEFINALTSKPKKYNTKRSAYYSILFPALQSLWIEAHSFKSLCTVEVLQDCLMERYERRAAVLKLKLTRCFELWHKDVQSLREIVNDVEWDEWEEPDVESGESDDSDDSNAWGSFFSY